MMEIARTRSYGLYCNLLGDEVCKPREKIIKAQANIVSWEDLKGAENQEKRITMSDSFLKASCCTFSKLSDMMLRSSQVLHYKYIKEAHDGSN